MNEQQIRNIIRDELEYLIKSDRYTFHKLIQILDGRNIQLGTANGTTIGTEITQKLGFYGGTPVDKPETVTNPGNVGGTYNQAEVQAIVDAVIAIIDRLQEINLIK